MFGKFLVSGHYFFFMISLEFVCDCKLKMNQKHNVFYATIFYYPSFAIKETQLFIVSFTHDLYEQ